MDKAYFVDNNPHTGHDWHGNAADGIGGSLHRGNELVDDVTALDESDAVRFVGRQELVEASQRIEQSEVEGLARAQALFETEHKHRMYEAQLHPDQYDGLCAWLALQLDEIEADLKKEYPNIQLNIDEEMICEAHLLAEYIKEANPGKDDTRLIEIAKAMHREIEAQRALRTLQKQYALTA